jgi:hypothetical protein
VTPSEESNAGLSTNRFAVRKGTNRHRIWKALALAGVIPRRVGSIWVIREQDAHLLQPFLGEESDGPSPAA